MSVAASSLYPLVHEFLIQSGLKKTASKFESESGVTLSGERSERGLLEIYNLYLANQPKPAAKRKAEKEPESEEAAEPVAEPKKKNKKDKAAAVAPVAVVEEVKEDATKEKKKKSKKAKEEVTEAPAAAAEEEVALPKKSNKVTETPVDQTNGNGKKKSKKEKVVEESTSSSNDDAAPSPVADSEVEANGNGKKKSKKATPAPFQRIDPGEKLDWMPDHEFDANAQGCGTTWGAKANDKLVVTRGKGFRHEKTKAKRGTYRGGELTTGIHSIKLS